MHFFFSITGILFIKNYIHVYVTLQRNCLFWLTFYKMAPLLRIDNKTINCISLPLHKAYPVSSVARSNLLAQQSKWLLISNSQKCSFSDLCLKKSEILIRL